MVIAPARQSQASSSPRKWGPRNSLVAQRPQRTQRENAYTSASSAVSARNQNCDWGPAFAGMAKVKQSAESLVEPEPVSGPIGPHAGSSPMSRHACNRALLRSRASPECSAPNERWALKQVQGDVEGERGS